MLLLNFVATVRLFQLTRAMVNDGNHTVVLLRSSISEVGPSVFLPRKNAGMARCPCPHLPVRLGRPKRLHTTALFASWLTPLDRGCYTSVDMPRSRGWGFALFVVVSLATLVVTPGAADDLEGVSQGSHLQLMVVDKTPDVKPASISTAPRNPRTSSPQKSYGKPESANLLELICVRLC